MKGFIVFMSAIACVFFEVVLAFAIPDFLAPMFGLALSAVIGVFLLVWAGFIMLLGLMGYYWLLQGFVKGYVGGAR